MKTESVKIERFKAIKNLEVSTVSNLIIARGDNGVGKSSFLQFIEMALGKQTNIPPGAEGKGEVVVNRNGDLITFKLEFKDGKPYIKVTGPGVSIDNKKGAIAELVGAMEFDIDEFVDLSKTKAGRAEQVKKFKGFFPEEVQIEIAKSEANIKNKEDERTQLGRDIKNLEGAINLHPLKNLPDKNLLEIHPVDTAAAMNQLNEIRKKNSEVERIENGLVERKGKMADKNTRISELQAEIDKLNGEVEVIHTEILKAQKWLKENPKHDTSEIEKTIQDAGVINEEYNKAKTLLADREKLKTYKDEYGELTAHIESSREAIATAIREMEGPIEGLTYDDEQLIYNGIPVSPDSLSTSEIMELGVMLKMAENPDLGILFIQRGESLGAERLERIKALADKEGWQIIMEQVQRGLKELTIEVVRDQVAS